MPDRSQIPRPLGDRVLVKVIDEQEGTIHNTGQFGPMLVVDDDVVDLSGKRKPKPARGIVTAIGPGVLWMNATGEEPARAYVPMELKVGDEVLFYSEVGVPVTIEEEDLLLVGEQAILVVLSSMRGQPAVFEGMEDRNDDDA